MITQTWNLWWRDMTQTYSTQKHISHTTFITFKRKSHSKPELFAKSSEPRQPWVFSKAWLQCPRSLWQAKYLSTGHVLSASILVSHRFQVRWHLIWVGIPWWIAGSAPTLPDLPQVITLQCCVSVSREIWISGVSSHQSVLRNHILAVHHPALAALRFGLVLNQGTRHKCPHTRSPPGQHGCVSSHGEHLCCRCVCFNYVVAHVVNSLHLTL